MKTQIFCLLVGLSFAFLFVGSSTAFAEPPVVQYLYPEGGMPGLVCEIAGSGFAPIAADNTIHFVTDTLDFTVIPDYYIDSGWNEMLIFTLPDTIDPGKYDISVEVNGEMSTYDSTQPVFTVSGPPHHIRKYGEETSYSATFQGQNFYFSGIVVDEQGRKTGEEPTLQSTNPSVALVTDNFQFVAVNNGAASIQATYPGVPVLDLPVTVNIPENAPFISQLSVNPSSLSVTDVTQTVSLTAIVDNYPNQGYSISVVPPPFANSFGNFDADLIDLGGGTVRITYSMELLGSPGLGTYDLTFGVSGSPQAGRWYLLQSTSPDNGPWINAVESFTDFQPGTPIDIVGGNFAEDPTDNEIRFYGKDGLVKTNAFRDSFHWGISVIIPENATSGEFTVFTDGKESNRYPYTIGPEETPTPIETPSATMTPTSTPTSIPGDFSGDGQVDVQDMTQIMANFTTNDPNYSLNDDGVVDYMDIFIMSTLWYSD